MQKLIMPFKRQMMLCGYKNAQYLAYWKYQHYGVDISTIQGGAGADPTIYASGDGVVVAAGKDNSLGYGLAVLYKDCYNHKTGKSCDLVARYMHMRQLYVASGQTVKAGDKLAVEGKEGTGDYHLHIEFDTDTQWPVYTPQVAAGRTFWKKGIDSTVNPSHVLHIGAGQGIVKPTYNPAWLNPEDFAIPLAEDAPDYKALHEAEKAAHAATQAKFEALKAGISALVEKYKEE